MASIDSNKTSLKALVWLAIVAAVAVSPHVRAADDDATKQYLGAWKNDNPKDEEVIKIEYNRIVSFAHGQLNFISAKLSPGKVTLSAQGQKMTASLELKDGKLKYTPAQGQANTYTKLDKTPDELTLKPMKFGDKKDVPADKLKEIQAEFAKRLETDQAVRKDASKRDQMGKVDADNTGYLIKLVQEYGWLDVKHFGEATSNTAFLIVQHSGNLPLMIAALPEIEKDLKLGLLRDGQNFALLYDRTQLYQGFKQKYGTQVGQNEKGDPIVLPLEDKNKVEQYRKELGIFPLSQYLGFFEQQFGKKVKFADE